jgi:hypothetical protein
MLRARLRGAQGWKDACILNISVRGMMVQTASAPPRGSYVEVHRGHHLMVARVAWHKGHRCGLRCQDAIAIDALVADPEDPAGAPAVSQPAVERRSQPRSPNLRHERSREMSRAIEFAMLALLGAAGAAAAFSVVQSALASPLARVSEALGQGAG